MTLRHWSALAALLGMLLLAELALPLPGAAPLPLPSPGVSRAAAQPGAAIGQWSATALARPLFDPSRRPADQGGEDGGLPRLSAIIVTDGVRSAIFAADGQKPQIIGEGGSIGGYRVRDILPDAVRLDGPAGPLTLHPQFITTSPAPTGTGSNS